VRARGALARAAVVLGVGLPLALVMSALLAVRASAAEGWLAAGYRRLVLDAVWARFDVAALLVCGVAAIAAVVAAVRPRPAGRGAVLAAVVAAGVVAIRVVAPLVGRPSGPNLLLISIDTLRADRLGAYGAPLPTSPTFDRRLAGEGVLFETAWSQSPKTTPSHMTLFTSLFPSVHGVELWDGTAPGHALRPGIHTLAEVLRNAGYATAAFTGGAHMEGGWGFRQGFQVYEECDGEELGRARRWLRRHADRPFFLFFHTYQVHDPYLPPLATVDRMDGAYRGPLRDVVRELRNDPGAWVDAHRRFWSAVDRDDPASVAFVSHLYDAGVLHMDETTLAPLLEHLAALGRERDTLVVFTADHGEAFLEHGRFLHDDLHAETLHVPLVFRLPGRLPAGHRVAAPVRLIDVMPTILDLLGVAGPPGMQGRSLAALARGGGDAGDAPPVASEFSSPAHGRVYEALRAGGRTYVVDGGAEHLYADAAEHEDVAAREPATLAALRAELDAWRAACRARAATLGPPGDVLVPRDENVQRLRALGYIE
jgi:arylsulfatase A-like enzyme